MENDNSTAGKVKTELAHLLKTNPREFNKVRLASNHEPIDLSETKLQGATLTGAKLINIDFSNADFEYANLTAAELQNSTFVGTKFKYTNLEKVNFSHSNLEGADFIGCQLESAIVDEANLSNANFSKANLTNASANKTNFSGTNLTSTNLSGTNLQTALNLKDAIYDKFTRWPSTSNLPPDFRPEGVQLSDEAAPATAQGAPQQGAVKAPMTPEQLKSKLIDKIDVKDVDLQVIEKQQLLLDRKMDYIIASFKKLNEKLITSEKDDDRDPLSASGYKSGGGASDQKLKELEEKVDNIASILTKFPVKSLEETYKLKDVIHQIEKNQQDIYLKVSEFVVEVNNVNKEIQNFFEGKLKISSIEGLDQMLAKNAQDLATKLKESELKIIEQQSQVEVKLDNTIIASEIENQMNVVNKAIGENLERKFEIQGLFIKQIKDEVESIKRETDLNKIFNDIVSTFDKSSVNIQELTQRIAKDQEEKITHLTNRIKIIDNKIDILSETNTLNVIGGMITDFGSGLKGELDKIVEASKGLEAKLSRFTGGTGDQDGATGPEILVQAVKETLMEVFSDDSSKNNIFRTISGIEGTVKTLEEKFSTLDMSGLSSLELAIRAKLDDMSEAVIDVDVLKDSIKSIDDKFSMMDLSSLSNLETAIKEKLDNLGESLTKVDVLKETMKSLEDKFALMDLSGLSDLETVIRTRLDNLEEAIIDVGALKETEDNIKNQITELSQVLLDIEVIKEVETNIKNRIDELQTAVITRTDSVESILTEIIKETASLPAASKAFDINDEINQLRALAASVDGKIKEVEKFDPSQADKTLSYLQENVDFIVERTKLLTEGADSEEISDKVSSLMNLSSSITEKIESLGQQAITPVVGETKTTVQTEFEDDTKELLEEFAIELQDLKELMQSTSATTKDSIIAQSISSQESINKLREDLTLSIDSLVNTIANQSFEALPIDKLFEKMQLNQEIVGDQLQMKAVEDKIASKVSSLLEIVNNKADMLEQKVDTIAQGDAKNDTISEVLEEFKANLLTELKGGGMDQSQQDQLMEKFEDVIYEFECVNDKLSSIQSISEDMSSQILKLDEITLQNMADRINILIDKGVKIDSDALIDTIKTELQEKMNDLNLEGVFAALTNKLIEHTNALHDQVIQSTQTIDSKVNQLIQQDHMEIANNILDNVNKLKEISVANSNRLITLQENADNSMALFKTIDNTIANETSTFKLIISNMNGELDKIQETSDNTEVIALIHEVIASYSEIATQLDEVVNMTSRMDFESLVDDMKAKLQEQLSEALKHDLTFEQILNNLSTNLTDKLSNVIEQNKGIEQKIESLISMDRAEEIQNIMAELETIKTISSNITDKIESNKAEELTNLISEFQSEIVKKVDYLKEESVEQNNNNIQFLTETFESYNLKIQTAFEELFETNVAEGMDYITLDISLMKNALETMNDQIDKIITTTSTLDLTTFKEAIETKLNTLLENETTVKFENALSEINQNLTGKLDTCYNSNIDFITKLISELETSILNKSGIDQVESLALVADSTEVKLTELTGLFKDASLKLEDLQNYSHNILFTKTDAETLFDSSNLLKDKTDSILNKLQEKIDKDDSLNDEVNFTELKDTVNSVNSFMDALKEKLDVNITEDIDIKLNQIQKILLNKVEDIYSELITSFTAIDTKLEKLSVGEIVAQVDSLVSDMLVGIDKEINSVSKMLEGIDYTSTKLSGKISSFEEGITFISSHIEEKDKMFETIKSLEETLSILAAKAEEESENTPIESLLNFMHKDSDQKLSLMRELIDKTSEKSATLELEERLKKIEKHVQTENKRQNEKIINVLNSVKTLLTDIEELKTFKFSLNDTNEEENN